jgi:Mn2+/Fe2+ NRAMP family transporter
VKKILALAPGVGVFLEVGSVVTSAQAGAQFGARLLWAVLAGAAALVVLTELAARFSSVTRRSIPEALRLRFGAPIAAVPLVAVSIVGMLVLAAELAGAAGALELISGLSHRLIVIPVALMVALALWRGPLPLLPAILGVVGLGSVLLFVALFRAHPPAAAVAAGLVPHPAPASEWFLALSILGACISPFLFLFVARPPTPSRTSRLLGIGVLTALAGAVLLIAAALFQPLGLDVRHIRQLPSLMQVGLGRWGFLVFAASLAAACLGAALTVGPGLYRVAATLGWTSRSAVLAPMLVATALVVAGLDIVRLTGLAMGLAAAALPAIVGPFLVLLYDRRFVGGVLAWPGSEPPLSARG